MYLLMGDIVYNVFHWPKSFHNGLLAYFASGRGGALLIFNPIFKYPVLTDYFVDSFYNYQPQCCYQPWHSHKPVMSA